MLFIEPTPIPAEFDRYYDLSDLQKVAKSQPMSFYPRPEDRWHVSAEEWDAMAAAGVIVVPPGGHEVWDHPARAEAAREGILLDPVIRHRERIDPSRTAAWKAQGLLVTDRGLPVHPAGRLGVTTVLREEKHGGEAQEFGLGMATGLGREWYYGALNIGNIALMRRNEAGEPEYAVVTTERYHRGRIIHMESFPGGYVERGETIAEGCFREGNQEAGIEAGCAAAGVALSSLLDQPHGLWFLTPAIDDPCTLNVWLAEHFLVIDASEVPNIQNVALHAFDHAEIKNVRWELARRLLADDSKFLLGAHRRILQAHTATLEGDVQ
jgi:8-oxo-dGTP pyrophosphatase MutT (NUDIX family)